MDIQFILHRFGLYINSWRATLPRFNEEIYYFTTAS